MNVNIPLQHSQRFENKLLLRLELKFQAIPVYRFQVIAHQELFPETVENLLSGIAQFRLLILPVDLHFQFQKSDLIIC
jgi:hypothetical protein